MSKSLIDLRVRLATSPLAMTADAMFRVSALLADGRFQVPPIEARRVSAARRGGLHRTPAGRAAVIPVYGVLTQRSSFLETVGLGTSCSTIRSLFQSALSDPSIDRIVFDIDSPGGEVSGIQEMAAEIRDKRGIKPITGFANSIAASASYWLLAQCTEAYATVGGQVGGIGIVTEHADESRAMELAGVRTTLIAAGRYKTEGNSFSPLGREARSAMQAMVDGYGRDFERDVAIGRGVSVSTVRAKFGQGRMLRAKDAERAGMIDGVATLDDITSGRTRAAIRAGAYAGLPPKLATAMRELDGLS